MAYRITTRMANRSRTLRKHMTEPEIMLLSRLKGRGEDKPIFRRQYVLGAMIFDFYCPAAKLAVEIDGSTHWDEEKRAKDEARDRWLAGQGIEVMRIGQGRSTAICAQWRTPPSPARRRGVDRPRASLPSPPPALRRVVPLSHFVGKEGFRRWFGAG